MGRSRYKIYENHYPYFITSTIFDGVALFSDTEIASILLEAIDFLQQQRNVILYSYVIMHNHFHLIVEGELLGDNIKNLKAYTAKRIIESLESRGRNYVLKPLTKAKNMDGCSHQIWQEGYHPKQISNAKMMIQKIEYIHNNPVKCGFVDVPEHWRCSSARNYAGMKGLIPVSIFCG